MKIHTIAPVFLIVSCGWVAAQTIDEVVLPAKTDIYVVMQRTVDTSVARQGDRFHAEVEVPVTLNDQIIIPPGTFVLGFVDYSKQPGRLKGKSELRLRFDTVILPSGVTRKVAAALQSAEGARRDPESEDGTLEGGGSQGEETAGGAAKGAVGGGVIGALATGDLKGVGWGSGLGAATGALLGMLRKGNHVILPRGASITIQLDGPVRFVKPPDQPSGSPMKP